MYPSPNIADNKISEDRCDEACNTKHQKCKQNFDWKTKGDKMFLCGFFKDAVNIRAHIASNVKVINER